ncbi:MAG: tyrosine-type recombinase/integrase [Pseudomonadota bacterium]
MGCYRRKLSKGIRFFYSGQYLGQRYFSKAIYHTRQECSKAERKKLEEIDEQARNPKIDIKLKELFDHRLDVLELTRNKEYYRDNRRLLKQALNTWGNIFASEVTKKMVSDIILNEIKRCNREKLGNSRPNQLIKVLKATFNYANDQLGFEFKNPCIGIKRLPEDSKIKFIPTEEMIEAVKSISSQEQGVLIDFVYYTAARINEAIALEYKDVHDDYIVLYTRKSRNSNKVPRMVPRPEFIKSEGKGKVFKEWTAYPRFLEDKVEELGQSKWNWHGLRHRRASVWANEGKPLFELMMLLGHTQISTTQRYLHSLGIIRM